MTRVPRLFSRPKTAQCSPRLFSPTPPAPSPSSPSADQDHRRWSWLGGKMVKRELRQDGGVCGWLYVRGLTGPDYWPQPAGRSELQPVQPPPPRPGLEYVDLLQHKAVYSSPLLLVSLMVLYSSSVAASSSVFVLLTVRPGNWEDNLSSELWIADLPDYWEYIFKKSYI